MDIQGKESGSFMPIIIVMGISLAIALLWEELSFIKNSVGYVLNPTAGFLLKLNIVWGMTLIVGILSLAITIIQKYTTDQKTLREMKEEQKKLSEESKKFKNNPEKMMELQKESMKFIVPMMKISMRSFVFTAIPLILFFRWFNDFFIDIGNPKIIGMNWLLFYIISSIIFSSIFRKIFNVV